MTRLATRHCLRIVLLGATGTIGRATLSALLRRGHRVTCFVRRPSDVAAEFPVATIRAVDMADPLSIADEGIRGESFDVLISCMASRNGTADDARAVDYRAHKNALAAARSSNIADFILLSSICVQRPLLPFQQAKLAFENALIGSGLNFTIVRPTAYFKSLLGQVERVRQGKPFLLFGDGKLTACKPISNRDLAEFIADCVGNSDRHGRILPIGGPGDAITPRQQGEMLFGLLGLEPKFRHVPLWMFDTIAAMLKLGGRFSAIAARKAELAQIGRYYATESMLVLDPSTGGYDAAATPSTGNDTLAQHYAEIIRGEMTVERGDHSVF